MAPSTTKNKGGLALLLIFLIPLLLLTAYSGYHMYTYSTERADLKDDFSKANSIEHGLFSVDIWKDQVKDILIHQIEEFHLTDKQDSLIRSQVSDLLHQAVEDAERLIEKDDKGLGKKLRKLAVNTVVDWDDLHDKVPYFTETIMREIEEPETKEALKKVVKSKVQEYAKKTFDNRDSVMLAELYRKYGETTRFDFNDHIKAKTASLQTKTYNHTYIMLGVLAVFLAIWFFIFRFPRLVRPFFVISMILGLIILLAGLTSPMIEIDARIKELDFTILGDAILFQDQMLFYRSKSILQVVTLLLQSAQFDSKLVGVLILSFSVLLPVTKLLSSQFYLFGNQKFRNNKIINWLAFYSGKWSMGDVIVVAIFMAYVGFDGILQDQLGQLNMDTANLTSITTNQTAIQAGFILFLAFVLYSLILSEILKKIMNRKLGANRHDNSA